MFYCIEGEFDIEFDDGITHLSEGDLIMIPKGISHRPICKRLVKCLLIEKEGTLTSENTGGAYDGAKEPMFQDIKSRITESEVGVIISYAALDGSPEGVAKEAETYLSSDKLNFYGWVEGNRVIGICGFEVHSDKVEIHLISVAEDRQKQGVGGAMVDALQKMYELPFEAETVEEAVGFYRKLGFDTMAFMHPEWGEKYTCVLKTIKPQRQ